MRTYRNVGHIDELIANCMKTREYCMLKRCACQQSDAQAMKGFLTLIFISFLWLFALLVSSFSHLSSRLCFVLTHRSQSRSSSPLDSNCVSTWAPQLGCAKRSLPIITSASITTTLIIKEFANDNLPPDDTWILKLVYQNDLLPNSRNSSSKNIQGSE